MLSRNEFDTWFDDYRGRFPAVADYVGRQAFKEKLLDTWHQNLSAFGNDVLGAVTAGIMAGDWEPVANVSLGTFGSEIRKLCRAVLENRRRGHQRQEWQQHQQTQPLLDGSAMDGVYAGMAVDVLLEERTGQKPDVRDSASFADPHSCHWDHPTCGAYCAAIILADDHTAYEEEQCLKTLASHGLTWDEVQIRTRELKASHTRILEGAADGQERTGASLPCVVGRPSQAEQHADSVATAGSGFPPESEVAF